MKTTEYKPAGSDTVYVPVPAYNCEGCAFDSGKTFVMTPECSAAPGCSDYSDNGAVIWVAKPEAEVTFAGFSSHVWLSNADTIDPAHVVHAAEFDKAHVKRIADDMRGLILSRSNIAGIDLEPGFGFRLLQECDEGDPDSVAAHRHVPGLEHEECDQHYSEFDYGAAGWVATRLRIQRAGDIWLVFWHGKEEAEMEIRLCKNWEGWA